MGEQTVTIQVRSERGTIKSVDSSRLEESVHRSLRSSFALEGSKISNTSWDKMTDAANYLSRFSATKF